MADLERSVPASYFEAMYEASPDPWGYEIRAYETNKYRATLAALERRRYETALEIGCSIGVLTARLAQRCESLLAVDVSSRALERARERCCHFPGVRFERMVVPGQYPAGSFDLVVVSEVGYYWSREDLLQARELIVAGLVHGGHLLLVHWTPPIDDAPLTGDTVHDVFAADGELEQRVNRREATYRLDLFERRAPGRSRPE